MLNGEHDDQKSILIHGAQYLEDTLTTEEGSHVIVMGNLMLKCIHIAKNCHLLIDGSLRLGKANDNTIDTHGTLCIMSQSRLEIQGDLLIAETDYIDIQDGVIILINGLTSMAPSTHGCMLPTISIGNNTTIQTGEELVISRGSKYYSTTIGRGTRIIVGGSMYVQTSLCLCSGTSVKVTGELLIDGSLDLLENSTIEVEQKMEVRSKNSTLRIQDNCSISVQGDLTIEFTNVDIGLGTSITTARAVNFYSCNLRLLGSNTIRSDIIIITGCCIIGGNTSLIARSKIVFGRYSVIDPGCTLESREINTDSCVFGNNTMIIADKLDIDSPYKQSHGVIIGDNSRIRINGPTKCAQRLLIGPSCEFDTGEFKCNELRIGSRCRIKINRLCARENVYIGDGSSITIGGASIDVLLLSLGSMASINRDLRVRHGLILLPGSQLLAKGDIFCKCRIDNRGESMTVYGSLDAENIIASNTSIYIGRHLLINTLWLDPKSVLVVCGSLFGGRLRIGASNETQLVKVLALIQKACIINNDQVLDNCPTKRAMVKGDLYLHDKLSMIGQDLVVCGNAHLPSQCKALVTRKIIQTESRVVKKEIDSLRKTNEIDWWVY